MRKIYHRIIQIAGNVITVEAEEVAVDGGSALAKRTFKYRILCYP